MTDTQLEVRQERAGNGALVVSRLDDGFRVYSVSNPSQLYLVKKDGERWTCTCADFDVHQGDTTWRCKHILAVVPWEKREQQSASQPGNGRGVETPASAVGQNEPPAPPRIPQKRSRKGPNGSTQMLIKRSMSPDGRIDSVSVEFSVPVSDISNGEIKEKALKTLQLQKEIVATFLQLNGQNAARAAQTPQPAAPAKTNGKPVFARMIDIGKVNGKWGERFCINLQANGRWPKIFGTAEQLAAQIERAGYVINPENIEPGLKLNLACLVVTKPSDDGRYLNVERVLPLPKRGGNNGSAN